MNGMMRSKLTAILGIAVAIAISMALAACGASGSPSDASGSGSAGGFGNGSAGTSGSGAGDSSAMVSNATSGSAAATPASASPASAGDDYLPITLEDDDELVIDCPSSAAAGEPVRVLVPDVLDANLHVSVNGSEDFGMLVYGEAYEFVMPDEPVTVRVWLSSDGIAGS